MANARRSPLLTGFPSLFALECVTTAGHPALAGAAVTLAFVGSKSTIAPFWAMTTAHLGTAAAAAGIALINSVGNLGGFFGPYLVGIVKERTGGHLTALLMLGGALLCMGLLALTQRDPGKRSSSA